VFTLHEISKLDREVWKLRTSSLELKKPHAGVKKNVSLKKVLPNKFPRGGLSAGLSAQSMFEL
jgi:hypothetical protein